MAKLTPKQKAFCEEYLLDLNATQAAIRSGYSAKTANEQGNRLLANVSIRTHIDEALAERSRRTGINADRVIRELARLAFVNANNVINTEDATVKSNANEDDTAAIASVKVKVIPTKDGEGVEREIRLSDKLKALELLGKHLGMFTEKLEVKASINSTAKLDSLLNELGEDNE